MSPPAHYTGTYYVSGGGRDARPALSLSLCLPPRRPSPPYRRLTSCLMALLTSYLVAMDTKTTYYYYHYYYCSRFRAFAQYALEQTANRRTHILRPEIKGSIRSTQPRGTKTSRSKAKRDACIPYVVNGRKGTNRRVVTWYHIIRHWEMSVRNLLVEVIERAEKTSRIKY